MAQIETGSILESRWGYEQTNADFYQVVLRKGPWVTLQPLATVETSDGPTSMTGKAIPGEAAAAHAFRRKVFSYMPGRESVKIKDYAYAEPWDGTPVRVSSYG